MTTETTRTFPTRIDIPQASREQLIELLNRRLADAIDLYSQLKQAHWNVKGSDFIQLHELYDTIAAQLLEHVDAIAERATTLGGVALGTIRTAATASTLQEYPVDAVAGIDTLAVIADRLAAYGSAMRAAIEKALALDDQDSADLFIEVSRAADKQLWLIEAHLQSGEENQ
jgi:starvation-inducible DNA-binding protein